MFAGHNELVSAHEDWILTLLLEFAVPRVRDTELPNFEALLLYY